MALKAWPAAIAALWFASASFALAQFPPATTPKSAAASSSSSKPTDAASPTAAFEQLGPSEISGYRTLDVAALQAAAKKVDQAAGKDANPAVGESSAEVLARVVRLEAAKATVDRWLDAAYRSRTEIAAFDFGPDRDAALSNYLQRTLLLIDLAGRVNEHCFDLARTAARWAAPNPAARVALFEVYDKATSPHGAIALAPYIVNPDRADGSRKPLTPTEKLRVVELIGRAARRETIPDLVEVLDYAEDAPTLLLKIVEVLRDLGVPQDPRPGQAADVPLPPVKAGEIVQLLQFIPVEALTPELAKRRKDLIATFQSLDQKGLPAPAYRLGSFEVRPGDWILTYNPSPYNLFTNLSPGLYTHIGVVAEEIGGDGKRRMVVVEVLEHDATILATNIDAYVEGVTRYAVLRCRDAKAAAKMGQVAASIIGNPAEFDLTFQSKNIEQYKGQNLKGRKIKAYCAGVPLLCSQETTAPREAFFPIDEHPSGENLAENLERLGMAIGERMVTPTAPLFSAQMEIVGLKEPLHDPVKEIEERVFDHFARAIVERPLTPNPDLFQSLRLRMAKAAQGNPLLAQAIAAAAGVHADTDLVAGAKAAAVVETLDEIAYAQSNACRDLLGALGPGTPAELAAMGRTPDEIKAITTLRNRVPDLWTAVSTGKLTRTGLRAHLVEHYTKTGTAAIDARFFPPASSAVEPRTKTP